MTTHPEIDQADEIRALQSKLYDSQAQAKSLEIQLRYARQELVDAREELKWLSPGRVETIV